MNKVFKSFTVEAISLYILTLLATGLMFSAGLRSLLITAIALTLANTIARPAINLLLLPLNLLTFGLFRFVSVAITLFLVDLVLPEFTVGAFSLNRDATLSGLLPQLTFPPGIVSYIAFSFLLTAISSFAFWLLK
jgi:uncharacterized membrane protein YvlD (DUF360 family)